MAMYPNIANRRVDFDLPATENEILIWGPVTTTTTIGIADPDGDLSGGSGVDIEIALIFDPHNEASAVWYMWEQSINSKALYTVPEAAMAFRFTNNTTADVRIQVNR